ncbi:hypothetical protein JGR64_08400 [Luteimonas sp. MC1572]|uniref:hypothetical protein n=2 Tax=Luteimonas sp. MC1572 TaxID=2799325 RepID=UPI0019099B03|nr:hypothetical protein [Luteimonas sp. MC1572]QQO02239.1 hypothetical protein JGR64_08400 [Luteimonas sp. MC1572]
MNRMGKMAVGIALAMGMAFTGGTMAAGVERAAKPDGNVKFFLADPELGVAGVYTVNGTELYFEARRTLDAATGAPGALSLRVIDGEARTVALGGEPYAKQWEPQHGEFTKSDGFAYSDLLSGLGGALEAANLHVALSAEKSALADLARQAAGAPAARYPVRAGVDARRSSAPDAAQVADFYVRSAKELGIARERDGTIQANLGNGITLLGSQKFIADEPGADGQMGRIDAYSMVKAADGYVLASELGGDEVPKGWLESMEAENARDHHALATDFGRAATALNALAYSGTWAQGVAQGNPAEQATMQRLAQTLATHLLPVRDDAVAAGDVRRAAGGMYQTYIQVWRKPFVVIAEHSGTRVGKWRYNSATSTVKTHQGWTSYCNHGTCAATENMTHKCTFTGPRLTYYRVPARRTDAGGHTCSTPYWAIARGGHHNCHDDSSTQVRAVRGQAYGSNSYRCNDSIYWMYAPTCTAQ